MSQPVKDTTDTPPGNITTKECSLCFSLVIREGLIHETIQLPEERKTLKSFTNESAKLFLTKKGKKKSKV